MYRNPPKTQFFGKGLFAQENISALLNVRPVEFLRANASQCVRSQSRWKRIPTRIAARDFLKNLESDSFVEIFLKPKEVCTRLQVSDAHFVASALPQNRVLQGRKQSVPASRA